MAASQVMIYSQSRGAARSPKRRALGDATARVNNQSTNPPPRYKPAPQLLPKPPSPKLPHHESLHRNGALQVPSSTPGAGSLVENKRVSALSNERQRDSHRFSQSSAASTNASVTSKTRKRHIGPWLLGPTLGKGATGRVRKARHTVTGQAAAVKIVSRTSAAELRSKSVVEMEGILSQIPQKPDQRRIPFGIDREIVIMKVIEHPNVIKVLDVWENRGEMYIVLELVEGGELFDYIVKSGALPESEAVRIFRQIISGLAHCHRFLLCHRDVKPENILLDQDKNVKIVDFGMASMQPDGIWLDTSCGSPHYAAPEVALGHQYEGHKADIWSTGVVLYVMLVGTTPFGANYDVSDEVHGRDNLRRILDEVIAGEVSFPHYVSDDAQDLIISMLQHEPDHRITIDEMWSHPLLTKYDHYSKTHATHWVGGPPPQLTEAECGPILRRRSEVDMDVVGNLCTLWHTDDEEGILAHILMDDRNYEQVIYNRLLKSRIEQEENFQGSSIGISSSDYHHIGKTKPRLKRSATNSSLLGAGPKRQRSQFSIVDSVRRPSVHSRRAASEAGTDKSYDPYRHPLTSFQADHSKITVLRGHSRATSNVQSIRNKTLARIRDDKVYTISSSPPPLPIDQNGNVRELRRKLLVRNMSRSSFGSSVRSRSGSVVMRKSVSYKRGISFNHNRRISSARQTPPPRPRAPSPLNMQQRYIKDRLSSLSDAASQERQGTPEPYNMPQLRSRKEGGANPADNEIAAKRSNRLSAYLNEEARHVSMELEKYCDDAFGAPMKSLLQQESSSPSIIHRPQQAAVPPRKSSILPYAKAEDRLNSELYRQRSLPKPPMPESLALQQLLELEKARSSMAKKVSTLPRGTLDDVIKNLDRLIAKAAAELPDNEQDRRIMSAPEARNSENWYLSPVKEEGEIGWNASYTNVDNTRRHVSEPLYQGKGFGVKPKVREWNRDNLTVRPVRDHDPIPAPLVIRKRTSGASMRGKDASSHTNDCGDHLDYITARSKKRGAHMEDRRHGFYDTLESPLEPIEEDLKETRDPNASKRGSKESKIKSWFRKSASSQQSADTNERGPTPPAKDDWPLQTVRSRQEPVYNAPKVSNETSEDFIFRDGKKEKVATKNKFLKFFSRKDQRHKSIDIASLDEDDNISVAPSSIISQQAAAAMSGGLPNTSNLSVNKNVMFHNPNVGRTIQHQPQNWLARFLHVKPAKRVLAFQVNKARAQKEIRGILRDWRRYGMRDVVSDRAAGRIWARVDDVNTLHIKPVSIAIELFSVVQKGNKEDLCVARISQEKGAKSSFERVVQTMEGVLRGRELLVREKKNKREMRECLANWEAQ